MKNYLTNRNQPDHDFFGDAFDDFFAPVFFNRSMDNMRTDIKETENEYELSIDIPGFEREDINLTLNNGYLTIEAKRGETAENGKNYLRRERSISYARSYYVGDAVSEEDIKAKYKSGTLTINVPKKQKEQRKIKNIKID